MSYKFFQNKECEYFPCHEVENTKDFNCMFCYCPLYHLGKGCHGNPTFLDNNLKDCSKCTFPHKRENYDKIIETIKNQYYK